MEGSLFDSLARYVAGKRSRRGLLSALTALVTTFRPVGRGRAQFSSVGCGARGAACTMLRGCCAGLRCVSSALNPSYGICITGSGGRVTVGTALMMPGSDGAADQAAALVEEHESAETIDLRAERQARLRARREKDDRKAERQREKRDKRRERRKAEREKRRSARSRAKSGSVEVARTVEVSVSCPQGGIPQVVTIRNIGSATIDVAKVSSLLNPTEEEPFTPTEVKINPGSARQLQFGGAEGDVPGATWLISVPIFEASSLEGARVELRTGQVHFACCDGTGVCYGEVAKTEDKKSRRRRVRRRKPRRQRSDKD